MPMPTVSDIPVQSPDDRTMREKMAEVITEIGAQETQGDAQDVSIAAAEAEIVKLSGTDVEFTGNQTLTDNTLFTLFSVPVAQGSGIALELTLAIFGSDGTDHQVEMQRCLITAVNKAGTVTAVVTIISEDGLAASAGTLAVTVTAAEDADNVLEVRVTADTSLTPTTFKVAWFARVLYPNSIAITKVNADN